MDRIESKRFKRNPEVIKNMIKKEGYKVIALEELYVIFPSKFVDKGLTILGNISEVFGVIAVVDKDYNYGLYTIPARIDIEPSSIEEIEIDGVIYVKLTIEKHQLLFSSTKIVKNADITYPLFDLLIMQGKVPFYLEYEDLLEVFTNLPKYAGTKVGSHYLPIEIVISIIARDSKNPDIEYRWTKGDKKPMWIGLTNIYYSYKSTLAKIAGNYFKQGVIAAVVKPEKSVTDVEYALRQ